jgi:hypothetical protein
VDGSQRHKVKLEFQKPLVKRGREQKIKEGNF